MASRASRGARCAPPRGQGQACASPSGTAPWDTCPAPQLARYLGVLARRSIPGLRARHSVRWLVRGRCSRLGCGLFVLRLLLLLLNRRRRARGDAGIHARRDVAYGGGRQVRAHDVLHGRDVRRVRATGTRTTGTRTTRPWAEAAQGLRVIGDALIRTTRPGYLPADALFIALARRAQQRSHGQRAG